MSYLDSRSQNEFIKLLFSGTRNQIIGEVIITEIYSVLTDTTPDITHRNRLAIYVRFVSDNGKVRKRLLEINKSMDKTGLGITKNIYLNKKRIKYRHHCFSI